MSDRPSELEFKLNNVVLAVSDVAEWFDLGLQLGLPSTTLRLIAADSNIKDIKNERLAMLSEWLKYDTEASWEKLAAALATIGEKVVAANVRSQFMKISTGRTDDVERNEESDEIGLAMRQTIRGQFSSLLDKVESSLQANQVSVDRVRHFLIRYFRSDLWVKKSTDHGELFDAVSIAKLWNYDHYGPLEEVIKQLLPKDSPVKKMISEYKSQLNGYYTATKITDFIKQSKIEATYQDPDEPLVVRDFSFEDYCKLKVKLNLPGGRKVSAVTLSYVDQLWRSVAEEFDLPCLTAVIHSIVTGSLEVTWLILPHVAEKIIAEAKSMEMTGKAIPFVFDTFYNKNEIVELKVDDVILYSYKCPWIVFATPLYQASFMGNTDEVKKLLEGGADVNEPNDNEYGETALFGACRGEHVETAKVLLDRGANVDYQNKCGQSALWCASSSGTTECVKLLVKYGAQVDLLDEYGNTALIQVCRYGHVETARVLLDHGANVDHQNDDGETALNWACYVGKSETVSLLLKAGAKTDIQEESGVTALYWAAIRGYVNIVQMLVDHGATVDLGRYNENGWTGLMLASGDGHISTVRVLLEAKADPNITAEDGWTALYWAARGGYIELVELLVKYGAAVDIRNKDGGTALHKAALEDHVEVVKTLVNHGAAVDIKNKEGLTAWGMARVYGHQTVCEVLEQYTKQETRTEEQRGKRDHFGVALQAREVMAF